MITDAVEEVSDSEGQMRCQEWRPWVVEMKVLLVVTVSYLT